MKKYIVALIYTCVTMNSIAQKSAVGNWFIYLGNQKINKNWNWHNEVQYRNYNFIGDINQLLLRTGVGYNLSDNNDNILLGYGYIQSHTYNNTGAKDVKNEHRIFQQFITKQNIHLYHIQHRYRLEERFFTGDFKMRLRYFLSVNKPLNKKTMETNAVYLAAYNEIFLNTKSSVFDRNRIYGGVGYFINSHLSIETGFMTQLFENKNQSQFQIILYNNLPFTNN